MDRFGYSSENIPFSGIINYKLLSFPLYTTTDGNLDIGNKRLCGLSEPLNDDDVTPKSYVDKGELKEFKAIDKGPSVCETTNIASTPNIP